MMEYRTFINRTTAMNSLRRAGFSSAPVRFDSVLPEGNSKKTVLPVCIVPTLSLRRLITANRFACEVNYPDVRVGTTVYLNKKRVLCGDTLELAKVIRFVQQRGPKRVILDRELAGTKMWNVKDLLPV